MCVYYHASPERYVVGQTISIEDFQGETTRDHARRSPKEKNVNDLLDDNRPPKVLYSRKRCIFLFENLQQCMYYASKLPSQNIRIYKTHSNDTVFGGFPICLVNIVYKTTHKLQDKYISEYWSPTQKWRIKEYLAKSVVIDEIIGFQANLYCDDYLDDQITLRDF